MSIKQNSHLLITLYLMIFISLLVVVGTVIYLASSPDVSQSVTTLNGPWKFTVGDNMQYAQPDYNDSEWEMVDLTAPSGAHDDDVGLSGYVPGWDARGHKNYSGYAWYRLKVPLDSVSGNTLALAAPPAVDDAYQLFINGSLLGSAGDFSGAVPDVYSIQPRMFVLPENIRTEKNITISFRVWMSSSSLGPGLGGIHIAPTLGEKSAIQKLYEFQWAQTIKGYIVEVTWPILFVLLAATMLWLDKKKGTRSYRWFIAGLVLLGLVRFNQVVYYWFQMLNAYQATILGIVVLRPLMLGSWLMACWEWFDHHRLKWLPKVIALLTLLYMTAQLLALPWVTNAGIQIYFQNAGDYLRLIILALMLYIIYEGFRKQKTKKILELVTLLLLTVSLFPQEVSYLKIIPGIWFPYGVGVSRSQFIYPVFVFLMYIILIKRAEKHLPDHALVASK